MSTRPQQNFSAIMVPPTSEIRLLLRSSRGLEGSAKLVIAMASSDSGTDRTSLWKHLRGVRAPEGWVRNHRAMGLAQQMGFNPTKLFGPHIFMFTNPLGPDGSLIVPPPIQDCLDAGWDITKVRGFKSWISSPAWVAVVEK